MSRSKAWVIICLVLLAGGLRAEDQQALEDIRNTAEGFVRRQAPSEGLVKIEVGALDGRLRLPHCTTPLEAFSPSGANRIGNTSVGVRCPAPKAWTIYVPVRVSVYRDVLVARHPLASGQILHTLDLRKERHDLATLPLGYLTSTDEAVGRALKRSLPRGLVLRPSMLRDPAVISRGDSITLLALARGVEVRMAGEALADGAPGQRISARAAGSRRIVRGTVISAGILKITP